MKEADETNSTLAKLVVRRQLLLRALVLVGATAGLGACKHLPGSTSPVERRKGDGGNGGGGGGNGGEGGGY